MFKRNSKRPRFRKVRRTSGIASWWTLWRLPILLAVVSAAWWFLYKPYAEQQGWQRVTYSFAMCGGPWSGSHGCVVDGDTIIIGSGPSRRRIRLTGFDAPERQGACQAETKRAAEAKAALHSWLSRGPFDWSGEDDPPRDQYGRELREVSRPLPGGGRDYLARHMIAADLASESGWGALATDWCK